MNQSDVVVIRRGREVALKLHKGGYSAEFIRMKLYSILHKLVMQQARKNPNAVVHFPSDALRRAFPVIFN